LPEELKPLGGYTALFNDIVKRNGVSVTFLYTKKAPFHKELNYCFYKVGAVRFELTTSCSQSFSLNQ
ncbi:MAG: hypothetical protein P8078_08195, partial [bacterium]